MASSTEAVAAIVAALEELASWSGSSRTLVLKQLMKDGAPKETASKQLSDGIKAGVASGVLRLEKQTIFLANKTFPKPADITLTMEVVTPATDTEAAPCGTGDEIVVDYIGYLEDGTEFQRATSFAFTIGFGEVIKGWDEGCRGMRPGEVRKLICPPKLAYGARGSMPEIPPNATLTFEITYVGPANDVGADEEP